MTDRQYHVDPDTIPEHWHYATGLTTHGAGVGDGKFASVTDVFDLAVELAGELERAEEFLQEGMGICADEEDAELLLREYNRLRVVEDALLHLTNFPRQRKMAFWADRQGELADKILRYVETYFPLVISHNESLWAWLCTAGQGCEHWREEQ